MLKKMQLLPTEGHERLQRAWTVLENIFQMFLLTEIWKLFADIG